LENCEDGRITLKQILGSYVASSYHTQRQVLVSLQLQGSATLTSAAELKHFLMHVSVHYEFVLKQSPSDYIRLYTFMPHPFEQQDYKLISPLSFIRAYIPNKAILGLSR
jgi:hypothetical protein